MSYILSFIISLHFPFHVISMFMPFINITKFSSHLMSCLHIPKKWIMERNCMYPKVLSLYETMIYKLYFII